VTAQELRRRVAQVRWFHSIDLGHGIVTPGQDADPRRIERMRLPADLSGRSVLDIGAWDGFYSFEAERRGARRVLATDSFSWQVHGDGTGKRGFDLAHEALRSGVEQREVDVMNLSPDEVGSFDVVLFLGVLYHLRHPLLALERVAAVTGELLILETEVDLALGRRPAMAFYPGQELRGDWTNWWGPNAAAVVAMLRDVGFAEVEVVSPNSLPYRAGRAGKRLGAALSERRRDALAHAQQGRITVHARR
jgi:tRNA (mo5U34)-methyltransferase